MSAEMRLHELGGPEADLAIEERANPSTAEKRPAVGRLYLDTVARLGFEA